MKKIYAKIKEYNDSQKDIFKIDRRKIDLEEFLNDILNYFEIKDNFKNRYDKAFSYPNKEKYIKQKDEILNYIIFFLDQIKPFLSLAYELSWSGDINNALKERKLTEEGIFNMLDNFANLYRHGRKPIFNPNERKEFQKFKEKYSNVIDYCKEIESYDGKTKGSIRDFANAIKKYGLTKESISRYLLELTPYLKNCSRATKYRFDKDLIFIENTKYWVEKAGNDFDFYKKALK